MVSWASTLDRGKLSLRETPLLSKREIFGRGSGGECTGPVRGCLARGSHPSSSMCGRLLTWEPIKETTKLERLSTRITTF